MPVNRNALIRYKTIDACLRNRHRQWTLAALVEKVSEALYEYEGIVKGISVRTIQADIQLMRSDKLGYFAPIVVRQKKYYTYEDPSYSITNLPLSEGDLSRMNEAVEVLKQFRGFSHFSSLNDVVQRLEDHLYSTAQKTAAVIDFEKNDNLKGLHFLDELYQAVVQQRVVQITYQSFQARQPQTLQFHVWWLKEFKNRWFAVGTTTKNWQIMTLALDRMLTIEPVIGVTYIGRQALSPEEYYRHVVGVSVNEGVRVTKVRLRVKMPHAPYIETKPLHASQRLLEREKGSIVIQLAVQLNHELEREIMGYGNGIEVLAPERLRNRIAQRLADALACYSTPTDVPPEQASCSDER